MLTSNQRWFANKSKFIAFKIATLNIYFWGRVNYEAVIQKTKQQQRMSILENPMPKEPLLLLALLWLPPLLLAFELNDSIHFQCPLSNRYHAHIYTQTAIDIEVKKGKIILKIIEKWTCDYWFFYIIFGIWLLLCCAILVNIVTRKVTQISQQANFVHKQRFNLIVLFQCLRINHNFNQFNESKLSTSILIHHKTHAIFRDIREKKARNKNRISSNHCENYLIFLPLFLLLSLDFNIYIYIIYVYR